MPCTCLLPDTVPTRPRPSIHLAFVFLSPSAAAAVVVVGRSHGSSGWRATTLPAQWVSRLPGSRGPPVNAISVNMAVYPRRSLPPRSAVDKRPRRPITQRGFANAMGLPRLVLRRRRRDELSLKVSFTRLPGQKKSIYSYQLRRRRRATARSVMCVQRAVEISA